MLDLSSLSFKKKIGNSKQGTRKIHKIAQIKSSKEFATESQLKKEICLEVLNTKSLKPIVVENSSNPSKKVRKISRKIIAKSPLELTREALDYLLPRQDKLRSSTRNYKFQTNDPRIIFRSNKRCKEIQDESSKILENIKLKNSEILKRLRTTLGHYDLNGVLESKYAPGEIEHYSENAYSQKRDKKTMKNSKNEILVRRSFM
ncbi:unnamed protein product [Moneuplotes crassus]|uniref:Uncharacterized protein n=1 Tax=Euplotes crassus TaxID=5936 RepID=A0AAD1XGT9_EUPCR|nr:unnamed protein product [Moneuplotes crassus]